MTPFASIRARLAVTQAEIAVPLGVTQGNISFYEKRGQAVPPDVAGKLIDFARSRQLPLTYDMVYGMVELPAQSTPASVDPQDRRSTEQTQPEGGQ